jgi:hypothetical protein
MVILLTASEKKSHKIHSVPTFNDIDPSTSYLRVCPMTKMIATM